MIQTETPPNPNSIKFLSEKTISTIGTEEFQKNEVNKIKSRRTRKNKFRSLLIEKDFEPENPKQLEELDENSCKWPIGHPDE